MPAKISNRVSTQVRIDEELYEKLKLIAGEEKRPMNGQLEYFVKKGVEAYEEEHGVIYLPSKR